MLPSDVPGEISPARARALSILHPLHALDPKLFAHYMWPTSSSWRATAPGRGAYLKACSFLSRLQADGLVSSGPADAGERYVVTPKGELLASAL